jgi:hypothetical protein
MARRASPDEAISFPGKVLLDARVDYHVVALSALLAM